MDTLELTTISPEQYGLDASKASELTANLPQIKQERDTLAAQHDEILKLDINAPETAKRAREIRLKLRDNRTKGIEKWHKNAKDYFLKGGQFVDAIKRMEVAVNERMEVNLEQIEKYAENQEKARIFALNERRKAEVAPYVESVENLDLGSMDQDVWEAYLSAKINAFTARIAAEKAAEAERIEAERKAEAARQWQMTFAPYKEFLNGEVDYTQPDLELQALLDQAKKIKAGHEEEQAKIKAENERLRKEAEEAAEKQRQAEIAAEKQRQEAQAALEAERKAAEEKQRQAEREAEIAREQLEFEKRQREEAERKQREQAEREEKERIAAEKKAKRAPDKVKLQSVAKTISELQFPEMASDEAKQILNAVRGLLQKVNDYIATQSNAL